MVDLRIFGLAEESIVDGKGIRFVIFTQGCKHNCLGCHNIESHDFKGGYLISSDEILNKIKSNVLLDGVTFSGGEPFEQATELTYLAKEIKKIGLNIWAYSGYTFEQLLSDEEKNELLLYVDVLVDGKFELKQRSLALKFRGSRNQRIIDVKASLSTGSCTPKQF